MKPIYFAALIAAVAALIAKKRFEKLQVYLAQETVTVEKKHEELRIAKANLSAMQDQDLLSKGKVPVLDRYIGAWTGTLPMYNELTDETKYLEKTYGMRLVNNSLNPEQQTVSIGGQHYTVSYRTYEFGADYSNAVSCLGALEQKFELFHIRSLDLVRGSKDELQFSLVLELPLLDSDTL
jgi:hypothetical protein